MKIKMIEKIKYSKIYNTISDMYYNVIWTVRNFFIYFKIVSKMRPWDYMYITQMVEFQLKLLYEEIKNGHEVDETRIPKEKNMERVIELLENLHEGNYYDRCGYIPNGTLWKENKVDENLTQVIFEKNPEYPDYNQSEVFDKSNKLENDEWNEIFDILKSDFRSWWN